MTSRRANRGPAAAAENRAALLAAARTVFNRHGSNVPMSLISETAGVGPGVLYRHFPDRASLTRAVFDEDIAVLEELAARPGCTLDQLLAAFLDQLVACTAFVATIRPDDHDPAHAAAVHRVRTLLDNRLTADPTHTLHPDTTAENLLLALGLVAALLTKTAEPLRRSVADEAWRLLRHGLDGGPR
ncbi:TetR/AcrR family transcriptional regulator [Nocardia takedensis]